MSVPVVIVDDHHHCLPDIHLVRRLQLSLTANLVFNAMIIAELGHPPAPPAFLRHPCIARGRTPGLILPHNDGYQRDFRARETIRQAGRVRCRDCRVSIAAGICRTCEPDHMAQTFMGDTNLETHIGEAAVKTVTQVFSSVRYKQEPLDLVTAQQRTSERRVFCELIKHFEASDALEDASKRASEWVQVVKELAPLYIENVDVEKLFDEFIEILEQYRDDKNARHEIWASGPFLDLPHHESSLEEIERMVNELERFLRTHSLDSSNPPAIVAIAKSTGDEFLPPHQLNFVLPNVLRMLERVFGELSIKHVEYEDGGDEDNGANPT
ncbi:hypothetical protein AM588_10001919 [Phytophthora nicotianae]|uniref:Uncharacterized protein n=1 Tax=Phytophthora nicotianae TaxID=4792 RepID=A0A0W8CQD7_PHYNI|nr:hypothetical protein AM588_10001919 [Phytophthora nicotianae]